MNRGSTINTRTDQQGRSHQELLDTARRRLGKRLPEDEQQQSEITMDLWMTRDKDGTYALYRGKPHFMGEDWTCSEDGEYLGPVSGKMIDRCAPNVMLWGGKDGIIELESITFKVKNG